MTKPARIRTLIVDDEPLARDTVRILLERDDEISIVGECQNGLGAVRCLNGGAIDLVFLDVQMPELDGFGVIDEIGPEAMPVVIFATAYDEYALRAFESHALDYLLKPFDDERFFGSLNRAKTRIQQAEAAQLTRKMAALLADYREQTDRGSPGTRGESDGRGDRISIRESGKLVLLDPREIRWVEAADYCVRIHAAAGSHLIRATLDAMERTLGSRRFLRVHRSAIVNLTCVREVRRASAGESSIVLTDGTVVKVSRTRRRDIERRLREL